MRWVNTGYSISFRCGTAVAVDNAGILFFVIDANVNRVLIVYIVYHIVGVWRRLLASQPSCPTCACTFLMSKYRQWIRSLVLSMRFAQPWAEFGRSRSLKPLGRVVLIISAAVRQRCRWLPVVFWKCRFYSNAFMNIWTLPWPRHCGLLIVPSPFQMSDPSLLHIPSDASTDLLWLWVAYVYQGKSPMNHRMRGDEALCCP